MLHAIKFQMNIVKMCQCKKLNCFFHFLKIFSFQKKTPDRCPQGRPWRFEGDMRRRGSGRGNATYGGRPAACQY